MVESQAIRLIKKDTILGSEPLGAEYVAHVPSSLTHQDAHIRAFQLLQEDMPGEAHLCWKQLDKVPKASV